MRKGRGSLTAVWVAAWRGLGSFDAPVVSTDPFARSLVPPLYRAALGVAESAPRFTRAAMRAAVFLSGGLARHLPMRTRAIDEAITAEVKSGTRQLVLLGAGLDARAHRLESLASVQVFEIDHPSTQADKRAAAVELPLRAREVRYVAVDFNEDDLVEKVEGAGLDLTRPTVFVWEGVTMYLPREAIEASLTSIAALAAPGSLLLVTYYTTHAMPGAKLAQPLFALAGEPLKTRIDAGEAETLLATHGFEVESDEGDPEWSLRWAGSPSRVSMSERLIAARSRGIAARTHQASGEIE
jgi:methyltransferase (TIGR00027 family)